MSTTYAQILDRVHTVVTAAVYPTPVYRERADAISRDECPAINLLPSDFVSEAKQDLDIHTEHLDLRIHVRADVGSVLAEQLHQLAHAAMAHDDVLRGLVCRLRLSTGAYDQASADMTSTVKRCRYQVVYDVPADTL